jgi:hypothetical protein
MTPTDVGRALGVSPRQVYAWLRGPYLPRHATVIRLADALSWEPLITASLAARMRSCATCGAVILAQGDNQRRRYCSPGCQRTGHARVAKGVQKETVRVFKSRLAVTQEAVAAFCRRCSDGWCPDPSCELNPVSPYIMPSHRRKRAAP